MVGDFLLAFVLSVLVYGSVAALIVIWIERLYQRRLRWWDVRLKTLNSAIDVINFANAVVTSILSSLELYRFEDRFLVRGSRTDTPLADYTLGSVCGYIAAEIGFVSLVGCNYVRRRNVGAWTLLKQIYAEMLLFHAVAFVGLTSVVLRNTGYPFALWVVWSELTSVFIGLQTFTEGNRHLSRIWGLCAAVLFVLQRVLLFYYLLWLCVKDFVWDTGFICQLGVLLAGSVLNTHLAWNFIANGV